jgi:hypothetical protein
MSDDTFDRLKQAGKIVAVRPTDDGGLEIEGDVPPPLAATEEERLRAAMGIGPKNPTKDELADLKGEERINT